MRVVGAELAQTFGMYGEDQALVQPRPEHCNAIRQIAFQNESKDFAAGGETNTPNRADARYVPMG